MNTEVFRQAASSHIIASAHAIHAGQLTNPCSPAGVAPRDLYYPPAEMPEQAVALILKLVNERIPARFGLDPIQQMQTEKATAGTRTAKQRLTTTSDRPHPGAGRPRHPRPGRGDASWPDAGRPA